MILLHSRRRWFAAAGLAAAAAVLIACGAADTDDDPVGLSDRELPTTARQLPSPSPSPAGDDQGEQANSGDGHGQQAAAGDCAAYVNSSSWCTDGIGDYDCEGGTGNGPNYAPRGVRVVEPGEDPFDLDRNNDGQGCEAPAPAPPAPPPPAPPATDPRFDTCGEAIAAGYGPYHRGQDPEYDWYRDADSDGVVCES